MALCIKAMAVLIIIHLNMVNTKMLEDNVAKKWHELNGQNHWEGLLDPLDIDMGGYIIQYGELAQSTYDAFITETASKYAGKCRYAKGDFFSKVGLKNGNHFKYGVTKFVYYATSSNPLPDAFVIKSSSKEALSTESNWFGFVAVSTDEGTKVLGRRDIVIVWRGTSQRSEWINDFKFLLVSAPKVFGENADPKVHLGWYSIYNSDDSKTSAREQVLSEVQKLVKLYKDEEVSITVTGHSLGAAVATLNAVDIVANGYNKGAPVTAFVFTSPGVGDDNFKRVVSGYKDLRILRIENEYDPVPNHLITGLFGCSHVGEVLNIDTTKSPYLKSFILHPNTHTLEVYLHGVAGTQGTKGEFKLDEMINRDIALVNKYSAVLEDEYLVPESWWIEKNKGMVQEEDGSWKLKDHEVDEDDMF
ncbi:hypothetical protein Lal_00044058 [Lupinus albus]|nr:hypothetical protein Lal_00044058 [Lupinus albus]